MLRKRAKKKVSNDLSNLKGYDDYDVTLGDVMRGERATLGKTLYDIERELHIKLDFIEAIEAGNKEAFNTPGFISGFVKSYAKYLNLDPDWAFAKFCKESGFEPFHGLSAQAAASRLALDEQEKSKQDGKGKRPAKANIYLGNVEESFWDKISMRAAGSSLVLLLVIVGLIYGTFTVVRQVQQVDLVPLEQAPVVISDIDNFTPIDGTDGESAVVFVPSNDALDRLYRPQALDAPVLVPRDGPIADLNPNSQGSFPEIVTPNVSGVNDVLRMALESEGIVVEEATESPAVQVVGMAPNSISIFATDQVWLRVLSADGTRLLEKVLSPAEEFVLPLTEKAAIIDRAGNSGALYFTVNGQIYGPAGLGNVVKNIELSEQHLVANYSVTDSTANPALEPVVAQLSMNANAAQ